MDEQRASTPTIDERRDPMSQVGATVCTHLVFICFLELVYRKMHPLQNKSILKRSFKFGYDLRHAIYLYAIEKIRNLCVSQAAFNRGPPSQFIPGVPPPRYNE